MLFKSRKQLIAEIEQLRETINQVQTKNQFLKEELEHHKRRGALMDATPLPKCEGLSCLDCRKAVYQRDQYGEVHLIGCGRNRMCKEYERAVPIPSIEEQSYALRC